MALDKQTFKDDLLSLFQDMRTRTEDSDQEFVNRFVDMTDQYVKSATIVYSNGLTTPNGAVTGTFNGNLE